MTNSEVQRLQSELNSLANYCSQANVLNFNLNRLIIRNGKIISDSIEEFFKSVPQDLKDLQANIEQVAKDELEKRSEKDKEVGDMLEFGLQFMTQQERDLWKDKSSALLEEDSDIKLYLIEDVSRIDHVDLPLAYHNILEKFLIN